MSRIRKCPLRLSRVLLPLLLIALILSLPCATRAGQHVIISLPDTVYQNEHSGDLWDTITFSYPTMTSVGNGLYLTSSGGTSPPRYWVINLQGGTINFGTADGNSLFGIKVYGGSSTHLPRYIKILNGTINHKPTHSRSSDTTIAKNNICLTINGVSDITIQNVNMMVDGYNGKCVGGSGYNVEIDGGHYKSLVDYYRSRCQVDAGVIMFSQTFDPVYAADSGYTYCQKIHGIKIDSCPHMGIRLDGGDYLEYGVFKIYACTIMNGRRKKLALSVLFRFVLFLGKSLWHSYPVSGARDRSL